LISKFQQKEIYREAEREKLILIKPAGKISKSPLIFKWAPLKEADFYNFELIDDELNTLWRKRIYGATKIILPENIRNRLRKGRTYIWKIEAFDNEHRRLGSNVKYFEIE